MRSLRELLATHASLLLIDSASTHVQVALLRPNAPPVWACSTEEAGIGVFTGARQALDAAGLALRDVSAFVFCDAPGSVLGIRTAAVAIRTWNVIHARPVFAYCSLAAVAYALVATEKARNFAVIADARRESWHHVSVDGAGQVSALTRVPRAALAGPLITPAGFRHWSTPPDDVRIVPYPLSDLLPVIDTAPLLRPTSEPDAFLHEEPTYQTWTPQVHRAPS